MKKCIIIVYNNKLYYLSGRQEYPQCVKIHKTLRLGRPTLNMVPNTVKPIH